MKNAKLPYFHDAPIGKIYAEEAKASPPAVLGPKDGVIKDTITTPDQQHGAARHQARQGLEATRPRPSTRRSANPRRGRSPGAARTARGALGQPTASASPGRRSPAGRVRAPVTGAPGSCPTPPGAGSTSGRHGGTAPDDGKAPAVGPDPPSGAGTDARAVPSAGSVPSGTAGFRTHVRQAAARAARYRTELRTERREGARPVHAPPAPTRPQPPREGLPPWQRRPPHRVPTPRRPAGSGAASNGTGWRSRLYRFDTKASPYAYIAPFFLVFAAFGLFPLIYTGWLSLHQVELTAATGPSGSASTTTRGSVDDEFFWKALRNTFTIGVISTVPQLLMALGLAHLLNYKLRAPQLLPGRDARAVRDLDRRRRAGLRPALRPRLRHDQLGACTSSASTTSTGSNGKWPSQIAISIDRDLALDRLQRADLPGRDAGRARRPVRGGGAGRGHRAGGSSST